MTSVSVVIPCYKYGQFLEEAVSSVLDDQSGRRCASTHHRRRLAR